MSAKTAFQEGKEQDFASGKQNLRINCNDKGQSDFNEMIKSEKSEDPEADWFGQNDVQTRLRVD